MKNSEELYSSHFANCVINAFLSYAAIMLNIVTIQALRKTPSLPKALKTLLLSLAVSDLGVGLLVQPLYATVLVMKMEGNDNNQNFDNINKVFGILENLFCYASFYSVTALSVDRFLAIHLHLRYKEHVTQERAVAVVVAIWIVGGFCSLIGFRWMSWDVVLIIFVTNGAVCLTATTLLYYKILVTVRRHSYQIRSLQAAENGEMTSAARVRKSAVGTFYVYLVLLVCYFPQNCLFSIELNTGKSTLGNHLSLYTLTMILLNSTLNPLIYCWKMQHIRHAVMNILLNSYRGRSLLASHS